MKIHPVEAELSHADGHTDMKLIVAFRKFANAHKKDIPHFTVNYVLSPCLEYAARLYIPSQRNQAHDVTPDMPTYI